MCICQQIMCIHVHIIYSSDTQRVSVELVCEWLRIIKETRKKHTCMMKRCTNIHYLSLSHIYSFNNVLGKYIIMQRANIFFVQYICITEKIKVYSISSLQYVQVCIVSNTACSRFFGSVDYTETNYSIISLACYWSGYWYITTIMIK